MIAVLIKMLEKYPFNTEENEAMGGAIGVLGWTKLVEGWKENKKRLRDKDLLDD